MTILPITPVRGERRRIAVIGSGVSGAACAWALSPGAQVTLYEAGERPGGHTATVDIDYDGREISVDTGFIVYNEANYPDLTALLAHLDVATHESDMSFALSLDGGRMEWSGQSYRALFARRRNAISPRFLFMLREILRFNRLCVADRAAGLLADITIGAYLDLRRFSRGFRDDYLIPMAAAIWSTPRLEMLDFPADTFVTFFDNHRLIHQDRPAWRTVTGGSRTYLKKLLGEVADLRLASPVESVVRDPFGAAITANGRSERFDAVVIAAHADQALSMLADADARERHLLEAVRFRPNRVVLHRDPRLMPVRRAAWSSWNYLRSERGGADTEVCVTYWMNRLQGIDEACPLFVSLNPAIEPREELVFGEWTFDHPQFDAAALAAQVQLAAGQGLRNTFFAGAWTRYGFHEDGLRSGLDAAEALGATIPWRALRPAAEELPLAAE